MPGEVFDPDCETHIQKGIRPHWSQEHAIVFITARLQDSIPKTVLQRWEREKQEWMKARGYEGHWSEILDLLPGEQQNAFRQHFNRCRETLLDECLGDCVLTDPVNAMIVNDSLLHFDGDRYHIGDFVVMPNHIHLLVAFADHNLMRSQCDSWLHFTATQINRRMGRKGKLWQQEPFDHLVRSPEQYDYLRRYIADNPVKAKLAPGTYLLRVYPDQKRDASC